uniref:Solute carrier family 2, facilitated glucose transporter member 5 n=1 Tax=Athene cunicularia TaxID=194338 RepID=A0A663N386_ATHCN
LSPLQKMTPTLLLVSLICGFGSSFLCGYNLSMISSAAWVDFYNKTYFKRNGVPVGRSFQTLLWSLTVSMYPLGGSFGSLMVWPLVNNCGRKGTLLINNIFSITAALLMGTSELAETFEVMIFSRFVMGIFAGLASNVVPMFLGEVSPKNLRGAIGIVPQVFVTAGILVAQIFGLNVILGNAEGWPLLLGLTVIPTLIQALTLPFLPESPRYLLIQKALQKLRGCNDVSEEIEEMQQEYWSEKEEGHLSALSLCTFRGLRWQLLSIVVMMMGQQLSGVNVVFYYADRIFQSAGVESSNVQYVTVLIGAVNVIVTLLAVSFCWEWKNCLWDLEICPYLPGPIPPVVISEMFLQSSRPAAFMVGGLVHWLCNFTVGLVFLYMEAGLGPYSFLIFSAFCVATAIYIFFVVPETKNKTFTQINRMMAKRSKVANQEDREFEDTYTVPGGTAEEVFCSGL